MREKKDSWEKGAKKALFLCGAGILAFFLLFFGFKYLLPCTLPFWLSLPVAALLWKPSERLSTLLHLPKKLSAGLMVFTFYGLLFSILFFLGRQSIRECGDFLSRFLREQGGFVGILDRFQTALSTHFPVLSEFFEKDAIAPSIAAALEKSLVGISERLTAWLPSALATAAGFLPEAILFLTALFLCSVFLTADYPGVVRRVHSLVPQKYRVALPEIRRRVRGFLVGYVKSSCILFFVSFGLLYAGFLFLDIRNAFFLAGLIAFVDLLPVLGLGTVLLPWGLFLFLTGDPFRGFGFFILYGTALLIKHLLMPHLLTKSAGLSPILTVLSLYAGYKCAGIFGILLFPLLAMGTVSLWRGWKEARKTRPASGRPSDREGKRTWVGE